MNTKNLLLTALLSSSLALFACSSDTDQTNNKDSNANTSQETEDRVLTDALGNEVTIPAKPERVIATYLEDNLVALGITPVAQWTVANGKQEYLQEYLKDVPTIAHDLPLEAVSSFKPDLLIMDSAAMVEGGKYNQYSKIAPTYVIGEEENNDWREELKQIGEIFGKEAEAEKVLDEYETKAEAAKKQLQESHKGESAAAVWLVNNSLFMVSENLSSGAVLYGDLGMAVPDVVKEVSASATGNWSAVSLEKLAELDADHLFLINSDKETGSEMLKDPLWANIPAVKNGNLYEFSRDSSWLYTGTIANSQIIDDVLESITE
ncbi:iron-hydroxamate ABC transporter substrate-binding protein [Cytobacillus horneckiae]|uniref:ABC transporter substrate-binding protein n=1 Tax=Cytobacillus horneckiae TaxID=549687 RepID=A0A2N0ZC26_9BACI|nr:iron-hydroxamate ABC transporter substrate-binding protein [Cytobacillus horneckiae]MEC1155978.1 iron-hydroxamate ABC transporter substrate-binding protein [Cytobacillus horneckiae]MED2939746.1 iron-hydroxamate ABC transporter substrate-binding protein [Cytobacillus horneckiae]PKG27058.1 ABC transporter substrate-binding protein [Cytobacillus horneckiae]